MLPRVPRREIPKEAKIKLSGYRWLPSLLSRERASLPSCWNTVSREEEDHGVLECLRIEEFPSLVSDGLQSHLFFHYSEADVWRVSECHEAMPSTTTDKAWDRKQVQLGVIYKIKTQGPRSVSPACSSSWIPV